MCVRAARGRRCVQSGHYPYRVDFNTMMQTNVGHPARKQRYLRRNDGFHS